MNKLNIIMVAALCLLLVSCSSEEAVQQEIAAPEPVIQPPAQPEEIAKDVNSFVIRAGDSISYKGVPITVDTIDAGGSGVALLFPDATRLKITGTKSPEISNGMEFEITAINFTKDRSVILHIQDFIPGENEYLLVKGEKASVAGKQVEVGSVTTDSGDNTWVNVAIDEAEYPVKLGETKAIEGLGITALRAFYRNGESALLKIVAQ